MGYDSARLHFAVFAFFGVHEPIRVQIETHCRNDRGEVDTVLISKRGRSVLTENKRISMLKISA